VPKQYWLTEKQSEPTVSPVEQPTDCTKTRYSLSPVPCSGWLLNTATTSAVYGAGAICEACVNEQGAQGILNKTVAREAYERWPSLQQ
jgi:hypothetical protein